MNFEHRLLSDKDQYRVIQKWYESHGGYQSMPYELLPKITVLTYIAGRMICSVGCYLSEGKVCFMDNFVSDPESDKVTRDEALDECILFALKLAHEQGYKYWNAHSKLPSLEKRSRKFKRIFMESGHYWMTGEI
jgi:hypothetical protein